MARDGKDQIRVENDSCSISIDSLNGKIVSLLDKKSGTQVISEPKLAECFRILVPLPAKQANYIDGKIQKLSSYQIVERGIILTWAGPLFNEEGAFDLTVKLNIMLAGEEIRFKATVENRTPYKLGEIWCPVLGGITGFAERAKTKALIPYAGWTVQEDIFTNLRGDYEYGTPVPEYLYDYPGHMPMQWVDIYNESRNRGFYFACHDPEPRYKVMRFELQPGNSHGRQDAWPDPGEAGSDVPIGLLMHWVFFPYVKPGANFQVPEIVLHFHDGDWHEAAAFYRDWFNAEFKPVDPQKWIHQEMAFLDTLFMLPEGNINFRFKDIPQWAESAKKRDIHAVLISGWDKGGHDSSYPYYEIEPQLGTLEELREGIEEIHRLGMKVFFFVNVQAVDVNTDWYTEELHKYRIMDPWGNSGIFGYGMGTVAARKQMTSRKLCKIDPSFKEVRDLLIRQFRKLVEIGADGLHIDKLCWASPIQNLNFNPEIEKLGFSPDESNWRGILTFCDELLDECQRINPSFCISIEGSWDQMIQYSDVVWMWHEKWGPDHTCALKYTFPQWIPCYAVPQPYDYVLVNDAMRFGYQLFIGPRNWMESMDHKTMKDLGDYIQETLRIREELKDTIYNGIFLDKQQVVVQKNSEFIQYNTHLHPVLGKRACILTNADKLPHEATVSFAESGTGRVSIYAPFTGVTEEQLPVPVTIPPQRFVILLEK